MSNASIEDRGRALEDEFFAREDQRKLAALREKLGEPASEQDLGEALGLADEGILQSLLTLGVTANSLAALRLIPLVAVAWADGQIQDEEKALLLTSAAKAGMAPGSPALLLLESWLQAKPQDSLLETWERYIKALVPSLSVEQTLLLKNKILQSVKDIAAASGGVLGFAATAASESAIIRRVQEAFER